MLQVIWLILLLATIAYGETDSQGNKKVYTNEVIRNNPGVYFEKIGSAQLSNEDWKLLTYIDVNNYYTRFDYVKLRFNQLTKFCSNHYLDYCHKVIITMQRTVDNVKNNMKQLKIQVGTKGATYTT